MKETYQKLPVEFKTKWLEALRSGEYKQGQGQLEAEGKYCCLGVACKMMYPTANFSNYQIIERSLLVHFENIPSMLFGNAEKNAVVAILAAMNDGLRVNNYISYYNNPQSFAQIADWIEENL